MHMSMLMHMFMLMSVLMVMPMLVLVDVFMVMVAATGAWWRVKARGQGGHSNCKIAFTAIHDPGYIRVQLL